MGGTPRTPPPPRQIPAWAVISALAVVLAGLLFAVTRDGGGADTDEDAAGDAPLEDADEGRPGDTIPPEPPASGTDGSTPPTSIAPTSLGSIEDPIPVGQSFVNGSYELRIDGVTYDADDALAAENPQHSPAPAGQERVLVEATVTYLDDFGYIDTSGLFLSITDGTETWIDFEANCGRVPDSLFDGLLVEAGQSVTGNACFTVTEGAGPLFVTVEGFDGPLHFALPER